MSESSTRNEVNRRRFVATAATHAAGATLAAGAAAAGADSARSEPREEAKSPDAKPPLRLHVVGNGCPAPVAEHYGSAFLLDLGEKCLMVDCGPGTTYKMARMGIRPGRVDHLFLTHHHFDHNCDFPCFALTRWDMSAGGEPLYVFGPPPTRTFVDRLLGTEGAFFDDWNSRIHHPVSQAIHKRRGGSLPRPAPAIDARDVGPGKVAEGEGWTATAARVHHVEPGLESLAYRFDTDRGSIVFAGDCGDCESLRKLAQGADTLVVACVYIGRSKAYADIITGTGEAADIALAAGVRRVLLSHAAPGFSRPEKKEQAIADVARTFDGIVLFPDELTTVELSP